ncbi:NYN domain-containing protein [Anabaena sp. FACHB-1237]|uniref:NYN domain-containing protein n=1 Tax=Anabaena sp. FACHB-1237 TaxID=2692769 RepID=UPI0016815ADD|nr:NYN domain-containing protein [Anabaena sp. FACHB-1237]MBD2138205.1 NYN domain-containing protein [Anabaena sp. FACHB-1237]
MSYHDSPVLNQISTLVCQTIISIQQQQPELLADKYKKINWQTSVNQSALSKKIITILSQAENWDELLHKLEFSLKALVKPPAFKLPILLDFFSAVELLNKQTSGEINEEVNEEKWIFNYRNLPPRIINGIAALLLDAENLQLNANTEKFLTTICHCPLQIKIAFANWSNRGKLDVELHERGYDLIHVPVGRDNADGKMIAVGSSIHERYHNVREVFVCSSDKVMTNLCNILQQNGILVYQVSQHGDKIVLLNSYTGESKIHTIKNIPDLPSLDKFIVQLKDIIRNQQKQTGHYWIKLSVVSKLFKSKYHITITQVVAYYFPDKKSSDVFMQYPADFVVHQIDEKSELYITIFDKNISHISSISNIANIANLDHQNHQKMMNNLPDTMINSSSDLEKSLQKIMANLTNNQANIYIDIGILSSKFCQEYGKAITQQLKELQINGSFVKFLQSCGSLQVQQNGQKWEVGIRL